MDLINTGSDSWILEYDACETLAREIMEHLSARDREEASSQIYDALSAKIRIKLKQFSAELFELKKKLSLASFVSSLTPEERERRKRQIETLQGREVQLIDYFNQRKIDDVSELLYNESRVKLFQKKRLEPTSSKIRTTNWLEHESNANKIFEADAIADMKNQNERLLKEQNEELESLLKVVTDQKQIAYSINDEVEHHNEILVEIADNMERVDGRMNQAKDMVAVIKKKDYIWGYWLVAFLLFIVIIGVAFI